MKNLSSVAILVMIVLLGTFQYVYGDPIRIPVWIKNTAKWWSEGQIGDPDFVNGIQYLIQQGIIQVPANQDQSTVTGKQIPTWVKNNAGWWANGTISDGDFVKGIQYLIQINIVNINSMNALSLSSYAFEDNGTIPSLYTCDGDNISPPLTITNAPANTTSLALIVDDIDAPRGVFTHWTIWNIPPNVSQFLAGENIDFPQGVTSTGKSGYHGPCPPSGSIHRYYFKLYALDSFFNLDESTTKTDLEQSMQGHILAQTLLIGKYSR